jgi:hypothetical protein
MLIANMNDTKPFRNFIEFILDWQLIYRDSREILSLVPEALPGDDPRDRGTDLGEFVPAHPQTGLICNSSHRNFAPPIRNMTGKSPSAKRSWGCCLGNCDGAAFRLAGPLRLSAAGVKETEMQLVQSEKLASLGRMSAGIIHEINNPLNFATTGLFTLRNKGKHLAPEQRGIRGNPQRRRGRPQAREKHRFRFADVHASNTAAAATRWTWPRSSRVAAFLSGEWKDKVHIEQNCRRTRSSGRTGTN